MSTWADGVAEAVAALEAAGKPALANLVSRLHDSEIRCRRASEHNLQVLQALRDKYEPRGKIEPYAVWTGD